MKEINPLGSFEQLMKSKIEPCIIGKIVCGFVENIDKFTEAERKAILNYINLACVSAVYFEAKPETITT